MKHEIFVDLTKGLPLIDASVFKTFWPSQKQASVSIARWLQSGKLIQLRRGKYLVPDRYRKKPIELEKIANLLVEPSYLSLQWALSHYQLIPEAAFTLTSVTTSRTSTFDTPVGMFTYRNLSKKFFWGYRVSSKEYPYHVAHPEKALLDLFHLTPGPFPKERLVQYRFQNTHLINRKRLLEYAKRFGKPKLTKLARQLIELFATLES